MQNIKNKLLKVINGVAWLYLVVIVGIMYFLGFFAVYVAIFQPVVGLAYSPLYFWGVALFCLAIAVFMSGLLLGDWRDFGWKKLTGLVCHKVLDWKTVCNPVTARWLPEVYE